MGLEIRYGNITINRDTFQEIRNRLIDKAEKEGRKWEFSEDEVETKIHNDVYHKYYGQPKVKRCYGLIIENGQCEPFNFWGCETEDGKIYLPAWLNNIKTASITSCGVSGHLRTVEYIDLIYRQLPGMMVEDDTGYFFDRKIENIKNAIRQFNKLSSAVAGYMKEDKGADMVLYAIPLLVIGFMFLLARERYF